MPTSTFWNLAAEKRDALIAIAVEEFADHDYSSASLSRIVTRAGIAKGSVYQYFADKRDLFLFVLDYASRTLLNTVESQTASNDEGFFVTLRRQMSATTQAAILHPQLARIVERAYLSPPPFLAELLAQGQNVRKEHLRRLVAKGQARGDLADDIPADLIVTLVEATIGAVGPFLVKTVALDATTILQSDATIFNTPAVEELYDQVIRVLRTGLGANKEPFQ